MNKVAVALAADSALTLGSPSGELKVYGSAEKIFQLSANAPVGIMIYGGAEFLGLPWETIIKEFRRGLDRKPLSTLDDYCEALLKFLVNRRLFPKSDQDTSVMGLAVSFFQDLLSEIESRLDSTVDAEEPDPSDYPPLVESVLESVEQQVVGYERIEGFDQSAVTSIRRKYQSQISELSRQVFQELPLSEENHTQINAIAIELVSRRSLSSLRSGVVVAGFGRREYMPRMRSFEADAVVGGRLRLVRGQTSEISRENNAVIVPFAQQEMVHTFMRGIDPDYFDFLRTTADGAMRGVVDQIRNFLSADDSRPAADLQSNLDKASRQLLDNLFQAWEEQQVAYWQPVIEIVNALPKDELASMAEALVNLTKFRRRVTTDRETVGGPVDVAIITRGDGFVWVRRKHYFQPELNPRVMARYQQMGR